MAFVPRKVCPNLDELYWITEDGGGYNKCIKGNSAQSIMYQSVLPNCTGYAYGRFMEILGSTSCRLSIGNAGRWYLNTSDGYKRGSDPQVGAVICWSKPNGAGHVAIVEEVRAEGSILTSESGWNGGWEGRFWTQERTNFDGRWGAARPYIFQGFIYNPNYENGNGPSDASKKFVDNAYSHVGENSLWTWNKYGIRGIPWNAAFISAVAAESGIINRCIHNTSNVSSICREGVRNGFGKYYQHVGQQDDYKPVKGDIVFFKYSQYSTSDEYDADHAGIVYSANESNIVTVEGDVGSNSKYTSKVCSKSYAISSSAISGYFHPDWSLVSGSDPSNSYYTGYLYDTFNTRKDMTVREVGYLDSSYKPSIRSSNIKLSVVNYTGILSLLFKAAVAGQSSDDKAVNTDKLQGNCRIVIEYLIGKGLNAAASCGIAGNIYHESNFNTSLTDSKEAAYGICRWKGLRGIAMKQIAGSDWSTNLTGQLNYLWHELSSMYDIAILTPLKSVSNDESGCKKASGIFLKVFECPSNADSLVVRRQNTACEYFSKIS